MRRILKNKKGANLIIVVIFLMLLMVIAVGLSAVSSFGINSGVIQRSYTQAYYAAKSINMSIADAIVEEKLNLVKGWEEEFEAALNNKAYYEYENPDAPEELRVIKKINIPDDKLTYSNSGYTDEIAGTGIEVTNKITLQYERESNLKYKVKDLIVETTAYYKEQQYTIKARILNESYLGGGDDSETVHSYYIIGTTGTMYLSGAGDITGDLASNGSVIFNGVTADGSVVASDSITVQGSNCEISGGNLIAGGNITITAGGGRITKEASSDKGNIVSGGNIEISGAGGVIAGSIISLGDVHITGRGAEIGGDIIAGGDVTITGGGAFIGGNINALGNVYMKGGGTRVNGVIHSNQDVTLIGETAGGLKSGGSIHISGTTVTGNAEAAGNVALSSENPGWRSTVNGYIHANGIISDLINCGDKRTGGLTIPDVEYSYVLEQFENFGMDSSGSVQTVPDVRWSFTADYDERLDKSKSLDQCIQDGIFDTTNGDLYFETRGNIYINKDIQIVGDNKVFIEMTGTDSTITFFSDSQPGGIEAGDPQQLYIVSNNRNHIIIAGSNKNVINGQIYMPQSDLEYKYGNDVSINGVLVIKEIAGSNRWFANIKFNLSLADYSGTSLEGKMGKGSSGQGSPGEWSVEKYYR